MSVSSLLNSVCSIYARTQTKTPTGGMKDSFQRTRMEVRTRMEMSTSGWSTVLGGNRVRATHLFFFDSDPQLTAITSFIVVNGQQYQVLYSDNVAEMNHHWEVMARHTGGFEIAEPAP